MIKIFDIETVGLNPMEDRITCISIFQETFKPVSFYGEDESKILKQFFIAISNSKTLISFNGSSFDIPFIIKRALINKVHFSDNWKYIKHIDLKKIVNGFWYSYEKYVKGTLNDWAKILSLKQKDINGLEVIEAYKNKDWKTIIKHCCEDVKLTNELYKRILECGLL